MTSISSNWLIASMDSMASTVAAAHVAPGAPGAPGAEARATHVGSAWSRGAG